MTDEQIKQMWLDGQHDELTGQLMRIATTIANDISSKTMVGTEVDLDDVDSWALESMWMAIQSWDPDGRVPLRGWIAFKVRRDIIDIQRKATRKKRGGDMRRVPLDHLEVMASMDLEGMHAFSDDGEDDANVQPNTNNQLAHAMLTTRAVEDIAAATIDAEKALKVLPEHQQKILSSLAAGASLRDVGKALGRSHEWVRKQAARARAHVRIQLT